MKDASMMVPTLDSGGNSEMRDVVGNRDDAVTTASLAGRLHSVEEHLHSAQLVYPTLAAAITVTSSDVAWTLGNFATIVAADAITSPFDIHWAHFDAISANGAYELYLYYGAGDTFACSVPFVKAAAQDGLFSIKAQTVIIPANSQIRAKLASENAVADTADVKIVYYLY